MSSNQQQVLARVIWIGGGTDSGKTSAAQILAERHGLRAYHYDKHDLAHHQKLAETIPAYRDFLAASLDERWVYPQVRELFERTLQSFRDRFPLVIDDLMSLPLERGVVAEGFGLLPELLAPLLSDPTQALWLVPSKAFKESSMDRRGKPSFRHQVGDPVKARANLLERDRLLAEHIRAEALKLGYTVYEVDGGRTVEQMADWMERQFADFLTN